MIGIVESIQEILVEWMNILKPWKAIQYQWELFCKCLLSIFDLSSIEICKGSETKSLNPWIFLILRILLIWNPARICVGNRLCVRLRTISRNSWEVGTGWISFHEVFMVSYGWRLPPRWTLFDRFLWKSLARSYQRRSGRTLRKDPTTPTMEIFLKFTILTSCT